MSDPSVFLDAVASALERARQYNKDDHMAPAAILWPDKERQWEPLLTLGSYAPDERTGPAYYLRCMIARTLPTCCRPMPRRSSTSPAPGGLSSRSAEKHGAGFFGHQPSAAHRAVRSMVKCIKARHDFEMCPSVRCGGGVCKSAG